MRKIVTILFVLALALSPAVITTVPAAASATTWYVVQGGGGDQTGLSWASAFADIQDAVDAAGDGDTIRVGAGKYGAFSIAGKASISVIGDGGATVAAGDWVSINRGPIVDARTMAAVKDSRNISIRGIVVDGAVLSGLEGRWDVVAGIAYVNSTGSIADVMVVNTVGVQLGLGVAIIGRAGTSAVNLAGVTVQNATAGVIVWDAEADLDGCTITGMRPGGGFGVMDSGVGIVIGIPGASWQGPSTVKVKGSTISDNDDIGIYVCDGSTLEAHFNNIVGNAAFGVLNDGGQSVDARYNWWGHVGGPFPPTANPVSDGVDVIPWVGASVVTKTVTDGIVNARTEADTEVEVKGTARVTVTRYLSDPSVEATAYLVAQGEGIGACVPDRDGAAQTWPDDLATLIDDLYALGKWVDVYVGDVSQLEELEIRLYYTAAELTDIDETYQKYFRFFWWDGASWVQCSDSGVNTSARYIWARIDAATTPSLTNLGGTPFGGYGAPPTIPVCGCFIATAAYGTDTGVEIDVLREFRDTVLLADSVGAILVSVYYRTSPPVADWISRCEIVRAVVRVGLVGPLVAVLNWSRDWW